MQIFFCKGPLSKYLSFTSSVTTMHLCHSIKPAIDDMYMNKHGCVLIKLGQKQHAGFGPLTIVYQLFVPLTRDKGSHSTEK